MTDIKGRLMSNNLLTLHCEYVESPTNPKRYDRFNVYEYVRDVLGSHSLENFYPRVIGCFIAAYSKKEKEDITSFDRSYEDEKFFKRAGDAVSSIWDTCDLEAVTEKEKKNELLKAMGQAYRRFEQSQDRLWTASNGYDEPVAIDMEDKEAFFEAITKHVYSTSFFRKVYEIEKKQRPDGTLIRSNQRSSENCLGVLPMSIFDIDSGMTIAEAKEKMDRSGFAYCIVTTKSHGLKEEDRFRVFVPLTHEAKPGFELNGIEFMQDDRSIKMKQIREYWFIQKEIANKLGLLEHCDPSPLGDVARKFMPSPPVGAPTHVSYYEMDRPKFELSAVLKDAMLAKKTADDEVALRRAERIQKFGEGKTMQEKMVSNPELQIIYDRDYVFMTDPLEIIVKFETNDGNHVRLINPQSLNPRVKVPSHEYAIWAPAGLDGYVIRDFVAEETMNLLSYLRNKFPDEDEFSRLAKIKKDFPDLFPESLIYDNPYYYLTSLTKAIRDATETSADWAKVKGWLNEHKIARSIYCKDGMMTVYKNNGFRVEFPIVDTPERAQIGKSTDFFKEYALAVKDFARKRPQVGIENTAKMRV